MANVTFSKSCEAGLYTAAGNAAWSLLFHSKNTNEIFIGAGATLVGTTLGNYSVRNLELFTDCEEKTKIKAVFSITCLTSSAIWFGASKFNKNIQLPSPHINKLQRMIWFIFEKYFLS